MIHTTGLTGGGLASVFPIPGKSVTEFPTLKDFGAKGDGSDDSAAINWALSAIPAGGAIYATQPNNFYGIANPIVWPNKPVRLIGACRGATEIRAIASMDSMIHKDTTYILGGGIEQLTLNGNALANKNIKIDGGWNFNINTLAVTNALVKNFILGDGVTGCSTHVLSNLWIYNDHPYFTGPNLPVSNLEINGTDNHINDCFLVNAKTSNFVDNAAGTRGNGIHCWGWPITTFYAQNCFTMNGILGQYINCFADGCTVSGVDINSWDTSFMNGKFQWSAGSVGSAKGIRIASGVGRALVMGNTFSSTSGNAPSAANAIVQLGSGGSGTVVRYNPGASYAVG